MISIHRLSSPLVVNSKRYYIPYIDDSRFFVGLDIQSISFLPIGSIIAEDTNGAPVAMSHSNATKANSDTTITVNRI